MLTAHPMAVFRMLTGLVFFLLAMQMLETALQRMAGRRFKLFLKKHTQSKLRSVAGGVLVTGILQSSSIVNLLVLGLIGARVVQLENGLALLLGSNLGSTLNSWLVAGIGFSLQLESYVLPVTATAGLGMILSNPEKPYHNVFRFLFSLAFLFIALDFIKSGMQNMVSIIPISQLEQFPLFILIITGMTLTALLQTSSAMMAIALSALHAGGISLMMAMALVLGAEAGTSLKLFLAAAGNSPVKKRVATGNFIFNAVTMVVMGFLLAPCQRLILHITGSGNELMALVVFQTLTNLISLLLFWPVLHPLGKMLDRMFRQNQTESLFIHKIPATENGAGMEALENETLYLTGDVILHHFDVFQPGTVPEVPVKSHEQFSRKSASDKYAYIKLLHGSMHSYALSLQKYTTDPHDTVRIDQLMACIRNLMYAAKSIHDARSDIAQMSQSSNEIKYGFHRKAEFFMRVFYRNTALLLRETASAEKQQKLQSLFKDINEGYTENLQALYKDNLSKQVSETEISTLINFNRSLYTAYKSIAFALKDYLLDEQQAGYFDGLPGFIR